MLLDCTAKSSFRDEQRMHERIDRWVECSEQLFIYLVVVDVTSNITRAVILSSGCMYILHCVPCTVYTKIFLIPIVHIYTQSTVDFSITTTLPIVPASSISSSGGILPGLVFQRATGDFLSGIGRDHYALPPSSAAKILSCSNK